MSAATQDATPPHDKTRSEKRAFGVASGAHALHDGYTDLIYVMLPVWQTEFALSYAALGVLRAGFAGMMAALQIPATWLAQRLGVPLVLAGGTALAGIGFVLAGASAGFPMLVAALLLGGIGSSTQHPLASEIVARAFAGTRSLKALGGYNFAGDIGKMTLPALLALMLLVMNWRPALIILGAAGLFAAIAIYLLVPPHRPLKTDSVEETSARTPAPAFAFPVLLSIGIIDSATRMGFLLFLPFLLTDKGANIALVGLALTLVFAGGAAGKLVCAYIGARIGVIATVCLTELLTALAIIAAIYLPLAGVFVLLPLLGIALNGTSSVLYGSVPNLVNAEKRTRAFGIFYTGTIGSGALAPILYGLVGDRLGYAGALMVVAAIVVLTIPLVLSLRAVFREIERA